MGFSSCTIYRPALAEKLGIDEETLNEYIDECRSGGFARVWQIEDRGNFAVAQVSTSRKDKDTDEYETDFASFVSFCGHAYAAIKEYMTDTYGHFEKKPTGGKKTKDIFVFENGLAIQITNCNATTVYDAEENVKYYNYAIFSFVIPQSNSKSGSKTGGKKRMAGMNASRPGKKPAAKTATKSKKKSAPPPEDDEDEDDEEDEDGDELPF